MLVYRRVYIYGRFDSLTPKKKKSPEQNSTHNSHGLCYIETSLSFRHLVPVRQQISNTFRFVPLQGFHEQKKFCPRQDDPKCIRKKKKTCGSLCSLLLAKCDKCGETENSESLELMHMCMGNQQRRTLRFTFNCQKQLGKKLPHRTL